MLKDAGVKNAEVFTGQIDSYIPGFFRPTKRWDLLAIVDGNLLVCIEVKSQAGPSYGNNFNNRIEEAIGNAHDFWRAYQEKAFTSSMKPFLGFLMLLEHDAASTKAVKEKEPHFKVLPEFNNASYAKRYEIFCEKAQREGLYDATALQALGKSVETVGRRRSMRAGQRRCSLSYAVASRKCQQKGGEQGQAYVFQHRIFLAGKVSS